MTVIRPFRQEDTPALLVLVRELQAHECALYELMKPPDEIGAWYVERLLSLCAKQQGVILVAERQGEVVGYAAVMGCVEEDGADDEIAHRYGHVADLAVASAVRRKGIGSALLAAAEHHVRACGRSELRIGVLAANREAHELYLRSGFADHHVKLRKRLT